MSDNDPAQDDAISEVARAIDDRTPIDWPAVDESLGTARSGLARQLRTLQAIAAVHGPGGDTAAERGITESDGGQWWGHLRLLGAIGQGAFGDVYRAWDSRLDREVALKLIRPVASSGGADGPERFSTLVEEGRLLARVRHPNVLTVFGAETIDGRDGVWTELIRGRTLDEIVRDSGPLSAEEATVVGIDVCRALSAVHHGGLLHRDVKAQNAMRAEGGRIILMDFGAGLERALDDSSRAMDPAGTPTYVAPEIWDGAPPTVQSDLYGLGVLLYYLVAAAYPVVGSTILELREAHRSGRRRLLRDARPDLSADFIEIVERALSPDPALRFQTAGAFEAALSHWQASTARRHRLSWGAMVALAATVAAIGVGVVATRVWRDDASAPPGAAERPGDRAAILDAQADLVRALDLVCNENCRPSPDGRFVAHFRGGNLWLWATATGESTQITRKDPGSTEGAEIGTAVSFDGTMIAYTWRTLEGPYSLRVVGTSGVGQRTILTMNSADIPEPLEWSRDGKFVLTLLTRSVGGVDLAMVPTTPGIPTVIHTFRAGRPHVSLSPDSRYVVFSVPPTPPSLQSDLFIMGTDGSAARTLLADNAQNRDPIWTPDGRHVLFTSNRSGEVLGWLLRVEDVAQGPPTIALRAMAGASLIALSTNHELFYWLDVSSDEVYIAGIDPDAGVRELKSSPVPARLAYGHREPVWSPDGQHVAYVSKHGEEGQWLSIANALDGRVREVPLPLTELGRWEGLPKWTTDGGSVTFRGRDLQGRRGYFNADVTTGEISPVLLFAEHSKEARYGRFSWLLDGRLLYWHADRGLTARTVTTGDEVVISRQNGLASPSGTTIASLRVEKQGEGPRTAVMISTDGQERELYRFSGPEVVKLQSWTQDGRQLICTTHPVAAPGAALERLTQRVWRLRVVDGHATDTGMTIPITGGWQVAVSPDGRRIAYAPVKRTSAQMRMAQGFLPPSLR